MMTVVRKNGTAGTHRVKHAEPSQAGFRKVSSGSKNDTRTAKPACKEMSPQQQGKLIQEHNDQRLFTWAVGSDSLPDILKPCAEDIKKLPPWSNYKNLSDEPPKK